MLADRVGARPLLLLFSGAFAVLTIPLLALAPRSFAWLVLVQCVGLVIFCGYGAIAPYIMAEQFPAHLRATGIGLPYGLAVSVFGGAAPYLAAAADHARNAVAYSGYVAAAAVISFVCFLELRPTHTTRQPAAPRRQSFDADTGRYVEAARASE